MLISQEYHILDLTLKFQHKDVLNWKDNVGVYHWFSAWRLLLALLDTPPDEGGAGGAEQWHHAATRGEAGASPQHLLILQPEGQGLSGGDWAQAQVRTASFKQTFANISQSQIRPLPGPSPG